MPDSFATVLVLLYGDHTNLHRKCLTAIKDSIPATTPLRIGLNDVCEATCTWLEGGYLDPQMLVPGTLAAGNVMRGIEQGRILYYSTQNENLKKYPMMQRMLWEDPIKTPWAVWFDDDTIVAQDSPWWLELEKMAKVKSNMYLGEPWWVHYLPGQWDFIKGRSWFKGKEPQLVRGKPGIGFHTGGFVAIRTKILKALQWPDESLLHNGGDTLLSEAVRQMGGKINKFPTKKLGLHVNSQPRRGYREAPAGSTVDILR